MTTDQLRVSSGALSEWPIFSTSGPARELDVVSLEARTRSVALGVVSDRLVSSGIFRDLTLYLVVVGELFDADSKLAAALAARAGAWGDLGAERSSPIGREVVDRRVDASPKDSRWGLSVLEPGDLAEAIAFGMRRPSFVLCTPNDETEAWCNAVVRRAMAEGMGRDSLLVAGVELLRTQDVLMRSYGRFDDLPGIDLIGTPTSVAGLAARLHA
ncbi:MULTISPECIES: hypothetical protein [Nocardioides]|uniref:Uncharacterized protein n=1 Tax=Nocardioides vastitatis TaxID=2568655 RepID=A0ABW0ZJA6_9ACTN|nr:hypothetical protein [Nocardioides sp.]THI99048.1 hypothetical protein E7Z54_13025 [Nocardioides sp.]